MTLALIGLGAVLIGVAALAAYAVHHRWRERRWLAQPWEMR